MLSAFLTLMTREDKQKKSSFVLLLLALSVNAIFLIINYKVFFIPIDTGGFPTVAYRFLIGQKPYVDFLYMSGPIHPILMAGFIWLFGIGTKSWVAHLLFSSSGYLIATYLICRQHLNLFFSALVLLLAMVSFNWGYPHANYAQDTLFFLSIAMWLRIRELPLRSESSAYWHSFLVACFVVLAAFCRYDAGVPFFLLFFFACFVSQYRSSSLKGYMMGALLSFYLVCLFLIPDFYEFLHKSILGYGESKISRIKPLLSFKSLLEMFYIPLTVLGVFLVARPSHKEKMIHYLLVTSALGSLFFSYTTTNYQYCIFPFLLTCIALYQMIGREGIEVKYLKLRVSILILIFMAQLGLLYLVFSKSYDFYRQNNTYGLQTECVKGWKAPEEWGRGFDAFVEIIDKIVPVKDSVAILTDMHFLYPVLKRTPFLGLPINFHTGDLQYNQRERSLIRKAVLDSPPDWILTRKENAAIFPYDVTLFLTDLSPFVTANYDEIVSVRNYVLLKKK